jgi:hypothetical protein
MAFYRYYNTWERGVDTTPIMCRQTVSSLSVPEGVWQKIEAFVGGKWIDGARSYAGIWWAGDGRYERIATPPGQPDSDSSPSIGSPDAAGPPTPIPPKPAPLSPSPPGATAAPPPAF